VGGSENSDHRLRTVAAGPATPSSKHGIRLAFHGVSLSSSFMAQVFATGPCYTLFSSRGEQLVQTLRCSTVHTATIRENCSGWSQCTTATRSEQRALMDRRATARPMSRKHGSDGSIPQCGFQRRTICPQSTTLKPRTRR